MSIALLDVNFLVALFDPAHIHHEPAHHWFGLNKKQGWATCALTVNGCIRVLSSPAYPTVSTTPGEVAERLHEFSTSGHHHFWFHSISLTDSTLFRWAAITGHKTITDIYLLGLAVYHHGRLATFDRNIPLKAVQGAAPANLAVVA